MDTDRLMTQLQELPPELREPDDRFEQVRGRVRRTRRRRTAGLLGAGAAVLALAIPVTAQLLPETAELQPGGGVVDPRSLAQETAAGDVPPGATTVIELSEPVTVTRTGTSTVQLGEPPAGATGVALRVDCLGAGRFTFPDGSAMECGEAPATDRPLADLPLSEANVMPLDTEVTITTTSDASWQLMATYARTELTEWGVNAKGETFGVTNVHGDPDLVGVVATNGRLGYAYDADLDRAGGPEPTSPEHALELQEERAGKSLSAPVYESDGETVIGEFVITAPDLEEIESTAVVTRAP